MSFTILGTWSFTDTKRTGPIRYRITTVIKGLMYDTYTEVIEGMGQG